MIYLWEIPGDHKYRDYGDYKRDVSPDSYLLSDGKKLEPAKFSPIPVVDFQVSKSRVLKFDCLPNNSTAPLVNEHVKSILESVAPDDVQFFAARLMCKDGELDNYYFLNVTHTITGIDHEKSIYTKMSLADAIMSIHYLTYKAGCMRGHQLARDKEYTSNLLVTPKIKSIFEKERISGVWFVRPEDYYHPLTAEDLLSEHARMLEEENEKDEE